MDNSSENQDNDSSSAVEEAADSEKNFGAVELSQLSESQFLQIYFLKAAILMEPQDLEEGENRFSLKATFSLMGLLILVYLVTAFPDFRQIQRSWADWGVLFTPLVVDGQFWRLVTANFLHANLGHLGSNLFGLWVFGRMLEPLLKPLGMVGLFAAGLIGCDVFSLLLETNPSLGASGIAYGLTGASVTLYVLIHRHVQPDRLFHHLRGMFFLVVAYTGINLMTEHLAIWAHLGGFLGGVVFGVGYYRWLLARCDVEYKNLRGCV